MTSLADLPNTHVTFPSGETTGISRVLYTEHRDSNKMLLIVEETPFHPLSCSWPDQQADTGKLKLGGKGFTVSDTLTAAVNLENEDNLQLYVGTEIPPRHSAPSWRFFVAHMVDDPTNELADAVGKEITLEVDINRRKLLSATHTSTHLAALAMNKLAESYWHKEADMDGLGHPDLDKLAIEASKIMPGKAIDTYHFGKTIRKKYGFETTEFIEHLNDFTKAVNKQVADWIATNAKVVIKTDGPELEARRYWTCELDGTLVKFPCGGTHLAHLGELESINVTYEFADDKQTMIMYTIPKLKD